MNYRKLRQTYPVFVYKHYSVRITKSGVTFSYHFEAAPDLVFTPSITFPNVPASRVRQLSEAELNNLAFHLGLIELPSYWKAVCSPVIKVEAGTLTPDQITFWKTVLIKGMAEFYYVNQIDFTGKGFLALTAAKRSLKPAKRHDRAVPDRALVPVGGGKDSAVTVELLKQARVPFDILLSNPRAAARRASNGAGKKPIVVRRRIDPRLLHLNAKGYLNGHTPFSAYLAFMSVAAGVLYGCRYVVLSNERSANYGNLKYRGREINHQWSKTFEFERLFDRYSRRYLAKSIRYFSFLRPLYELQIAALFARLPQHFTSFRSCNVGIREDRWCLNCAKCLFTYTMLAPFLSEKTLKKIFKTNLLKKRSLLETFKELLGTSRHKPLECVGTEHEVHAAAQLAAAKEKAPLLSYAVGHLPHLSEKTINALFASYDKNNLLPPKFARILRKTLIQYKAHAQEYQRF